MYCCKLFCPGIGQCVAVKHFIFQQVIFHSFQQGIPAGMEAERSTKNWVTLAWKYQFTKSYLSSK